MFKSLNNELTHGACDSTVVEVDDWFGLCPCPCSGEKEGGGFRATRVVGLDVCGGKGGDVDTGNDPERGAGLMTVSP